MHPQDPFGQQPTPNPGQPMGPPQPPMPPQSQPQPHPGMGMPAPGGQPFPPQQPAQPANNPPFPGAAGPSPAMPPASPFPQQSAAAPQPGSPFPSAGAPSSMNPAFHPLAPAKQKKKAMAMVVLVVAALLVIGVVAFVATKLLGGSIKLEQYSNNNLTVLVPANYNRIEENGGATFEEKEGTDDTRSEVIAYYEALPSGLSEGDLEEFRGTLRTVLEQAAESSASTDGKEVKNMKITDITFNGDKALRLTADAVADGKKVGTYTMIAGLNSKAVYMIGVGAHTSDPGLAKSTDKIIDSFKLK